MPINVEHQPPMAAISQPAFLSGQGQYNKWFGEFQERAGARDDANNNNMLRQMMANDRLPYQYAAREQLQNNLQDLLYRRKMAEMEARHQQKLQEMAAMNGGVVGQDGQIAFPAVPNVGVPAPADPPAAKPGDLKMVF